MKRLFRLSRWIHKYVGLLLLLFLAWMSLSGVLMNHPHLISGFSVPAWLTPPQYRPENWNRNMMTDLVFSRDRPEIAFAAGKTGVWITTDGGYHFEPYNDGLPESLFYRKTRDLFLWEADGLAILFAATDGGLYMRTIDAGQWESVALGDKPDPVRKVLAYGDRLVVAAESAFYVSGLPPTRNSFVLTHTGREEIEPRVTLVQLFFDLHYGKAWGLAGLLLFDFVGLTLFFLCVSAFYTWYFPWQAKRNRKSWLLTNKTTKRAFKTMFHYHLQLGIWIAAVLLIIGGTGLFMRPPLLAVIADGSIPRTAYPGFLDDNPWKEKIRNVLHDPVDRSIIVQASDGLWIGRDSLDKPFRRHHLDVPIFVMGATVLEPAPDGYLVGSFSGLFQWLRSNGASIDLETGQTVSGSMSMRPANLMVTGYFETPAGESFVSTFEQGVVPIDGSETVGRFEQPAELGDSFRMPLWNYLFEIHNGRFFKDLVGTWHLLIIPLGSLLFILITLTGIYDWLYLKLSRHHP